MTTHPTNGSGPDDRALHFSDGVSIPTSGPYRIHRATDGLLYVVGRGMCVPVDSREEAEEVIRSLTQGRE